MPRSLEHVEVVPATPAISTQASTDDVPTLGETVEISDTAALTELIPTQPGDTITFWLVGPANGEPPTCGNVADAVIGPLAQPLDPATATATTGPQPFTPITAGNYYWVAQYTGDANNQGAMSTCPDAAELVTVPPATPTLATQASPATGTPGVPTQDTATVLGGFGPTGTVTFQLFGPADPASAGTPIATFPRHRAGRRNRNLTRSRHRDRRHLPMGGHIQRRHKQHPGDRLLRRSNRTHNHRRAPRTAPPVPLPPVPLPPVPLPPVPGPPVSGVLPAAGFSSPFTIWFGPFDLPVT